MNLELKQTTRKRIPIKLGLKGMSGSGKSLSSLLISKILCGGDVSKIAVIDSENAIMLYASIIGNFNVLNLSQPHSIERYLQAIEICEKAGMEVIIIDSISHCWHYLLQLHGSMQGNSFTNWQRITPLHNAFVQKIQQSPCHIICTMRSKTDYLMQTQNGKTTIEKVGLKAIQRPEIEYEFTTVLSIDMNHKAKAVKDRSGLFMDKPEFVITEATGKMILDWCNGGLAVNEAKLLQEKPIIHNLNPNNYGSITAQAS